MTASVKESEWQRWQQVASRKHDDGALVLSLCGPSGAGKTSAASTLKDIAAVFLETTNGNPQLPQLLAGQMDRFDAAANQIWFLEQMLAFIRQADPHRALVLDQDPAAIVFAYGQMWRESGSISGAGFETLLAKLLELEESLQRWCSPRTTLVLDAPAEILHRRVGGRDAAAPLPPSRWFQQVREHFVAMRDQFPDPISVSGTAAEIGEFARRRVLAHSNPR